MRFEVSHCVFIVKSRRKVFCKTLRQHLGEVFRDLAQQRECKIEEGHLMSDHVHILISIPPKNTRYCRWMGTSRAKERSTWRGHMGERKQNYVGQQFWARGYLVSTVNREEALIGEYIRNQEVADERLDQLNLCRSAPSRRSNLRPKR